MIPVFISLFIYFFFFFAMSKITKMEKNFSTAIVGFEAMTLNKHSRRSDHWAIGADDTKVREKILENIQVHHDQGGASPSWTMLQDVTTQACHFIGNP